MSIRIAEIFGPTIQGEGVLIGEPTIFIRTGGCDFRCSWCDSLHAVDSKFRDQWAKMSATQIFDKVQSLSGNRPLTVSISGGNPAIHDFTDVIALGKAKGYKFSCETQGSIARDWFADLDTLVISPKPPSSGQEFDRVGLEYAISAAQNTTPENTPKVVLKIVIFDDVDYVWARTVSNMFPELELFLQPGNPEVDPNLAVDLTKVTDRLNWLINKVTGDGWFTARVLPQLHVLVWGNKRGV